MGFLWSLPLGIDTIRELGDDAACLDWVRSPLSADRGVMGKGTFSNAAALQGMRGGA